MVPSGFAVVTGANTGLGLHFVKSLYASGTFASIVLACRSEQRAKSAIEQIIYNGQPSASKNGDNDGTRTKLAFIKLDLTSKESIRSFVDQLAAQNHQKYSLRLLVNNAGVMGHPFQLVDGVEVHFSTNHLGHFLLTNLLIEHNWLASDARLLLITSGLYEKCHSMLSVADLTSAPAKPSSAGEYYAFSKLANCLHTVALAKRLAAASQSDGKLGDIKVVAIRPGFIRGTELGRHTNFVLRMLAYPLIWMVSKNLDQGISSMLHCAQCDAAQLQNGALYYEGRPVPYSAMVTDEAADKLWQMSEQMTNRNE